FFSSNLPTPPHISTLSLHDALPIYVFANFAPTGRSELTKRVVFRRDALKIKHEVALTFAAARVACGKRSIRNDFHQIRNAVTHSFRTKDQIARQNRAGGTEQ